jgi:hypothetical protein
LPFYPPSYRPSLYLVVEEKSRDERCIIKKEAAVGLNAINPECTALLKPDHQVTTQLCQVIVLVA